MAYSELIKSFKAIRMYMRQFFVYGFKSREELADKSLRSYDNEKRRVESWLGDYMRFRQQRGGKSVFLSLDSRALCYNPFYHAYKAASFTKNDISLYFLLMDLLQDKRSYTLPQLLTRLDSDYLAFFPDPQPFNEATLRGKLKEYTELGILKSIKEGKSYRYQLFEDHLDLSSWKTAIAYFSEAAPLGVVGSYLLERYKKKEKQVFSFKHRYLLFALDEIILYELLTAIRDQVTVQLSILRADNRPYKNVVVPLMIYTSTQSGRQYLAGRNEHALHASFFRLDNIVEVKRLGKSRHYQKYSEEFAQQRTRIWGVSMGQGSLEKLSMELKVKPYESYIVERLEREKRCGTLEQLTKSNWLFTCEVYDAMELVPWLRTFIGRIVSLKCDNPQVLERFYADLKAMQEMYEVEADAVQ